ncbi:hypothetical protein CC85DRAFT_300524 [Cutaneotrichosporon oleaginosum]|uniref:Uncharacterized protein n=1 Tax=Cutaneotrichosporon oleaginosum TaxID=879819 RepID=A0A0J0XTH2_9TREE|nr:uncharacterized protein CC85DRAFT_300524 [Cutaneotrichosporon oleaginosum]KLT44381.1 hypothetical protein CC85DRAFT_300524 [Cutaneotrichosporon oleaginosum]TXT07896.1 hypothetical protein COLE_04820 [Cutaneotrichosporon oleaginosum]
MLDRTAYPGVIDAIFRVAPFDTLLLLRTASRDFRARVDANLAQHLLCDWYEVRCVNGGRHPAFWALCTQPQIPRPGGHYTLPEALGDASLLGNGIPPSIDALDIVGPQSIYPILLLTQRLKPWTVRLWVCGTPTDVDVPVALDADAIIVMGRPHGSAGPLAVHEEPRMALTTRVRRVVYHLSDKYAANAALFRQIEPRAAVLHDFEIVVIVSGLNRRGGFLLWEITHLQRDQPHLRVTVVNPPAQPMAAYPGAVSSQELAVRCGTFREWAQAVVERGHEREVFQEQWRFYSFEEYAHLVGARRFALEMGDA